MNAASWVRAVNACFNIDLALHLELVEALVAKKAYRTAPRSGQVARSVEKFALHHSGEALGGSAGSVVTQGADVACMLRSAKNGRQSPLVNWTDSSSRCTICPPEVLTVMMTRLAISYCEALGFAISVRVRIHQMTTPGLAAAPRRRCANGVRTGLRRLRLTCRSPERLAA